MTRWLLTLAALTLACAPAPFGREDEQGIRDVLQRQRDAWNRGDLEAFMSGYHRRPDIVFTSSGKIRRGYDQALAAYRERYAGTPERMGHLDFADVEVTGLGPDAGLTFGRFELTATPEAGAGVFTLVFTRENGHWGILHDHSSATPIESP